MRLTFAGVLADAWALFRRDGDLLLRIAAPFFFLPAYALVLLVPPMPLPDPDIADPQARIQAWADAVGGWVQGYGVGLIAGYLVACVGMATITALYCAVPRPAVRGALAEAARILPRFFLAMVLVSLPVGVGLWLFVLPGLYVVGRLMLTGPVLFAERPIGAWRAIVRSLALTRGHGAALTGLAGFAYLSGLIGGQPFLLLDGWMRGTPGGINPVAVAIVDAAAAGVAMLTQLALALIAVAAYRRLAR